MHTRDGKPMVEIADHKGELHEYAVVAVRTEPGRRVVELRRDDRDETYVVELLAGMIAACTCKDWRYHRGLFDPCKHITAAREIVDAMKAAAALLNQPVS